jgi:hypothetical protein
VLDREAKNRSITIDPTEHLFKLAIARKQFDRVLTIIKTGRLCGQAVIAYLQRAGYPEIAVRADDFSRRMLRSTLFTCSCFSWRTRLRSST